MPRNPLNIARNCAAQPRQLPSTMTSGNLEIAIRDQKLQLRLDLDGRQTQPQKSPTFILSGRQDLIVHRYVQYYDKKGILLLHGVGSGKTITSLAMALHSFDWTDERVTTARRITIVAPSGIYEQFIDTLKGVIPNIDRFVDAGKDAYGFPIVTAYYLGRQITFRGIKYSDLNKQYAALDKWKEMINLFKDDIVIFDEGHRLFRPILGKTEAIIEPMTERRVLKNCKRFILMTGTPFNLRDSDILTILKFIECNSLSTGNDERDAECYRNSSFATEKFFNGGGANIFIANTGPAVFDTFWAKLLFRAARLVGYIPFAVSGIEGAINMVNGIQARLKDYKSGLITLSVLLFGDKNVDAKYAKSKEGRIQNAPGVEPDKEEEENENENENENEEETIMFGFGGGPTTMGGAIHSYDNAYKILNLNTSASQTNIDKAFRRKALQYHPDKSTSEEDKQKFMNITAAKNLLSKKTESKDIAGDITNIITSTFSKEDLDGFLSRIIGVLTAPGYVSYVENNIELFKLIDDIPENNLSGAMSLLLDEYKTDVLPLLKDNDGNIQQGKIDESIAETIQMFKYKDISTTVVNKLRLTNVQPSLQIENMNKQTGGGLGDWAFGPDRAENALKKYLINRNNLTVPVDYVALAKKAFEYTSIIDVTMKDVDSAFIGSMITIDDNMTKAMGFNETNLDIIDSNIKEVQTIKGYKYPDKHVEFLFVQYDGHQQGFAADMFAKKNLRKVKHWDAKFKTDKKDPRNTATRSIGNYSPDFEDYTAEYNGADLFPKYQLKKVIGKTDVAMTGKVMFECPKFKKLLQHLLIMKTGKMYTTEMNIIDQPHLTKSIKDQTLGYINKHGRPVCFGDDPYDLQDFPSHVPYTKYEDATHYYLPLVWSSNDVAGINLFAAYLESKGLKYIVLHAEADKSVLEREKLRGLSRTYPLDKRLNIFERITELISRATPDEISQEIDKLLESINKDDPICVLLHPDMTEGIDCKFNPAIFLLEPPNTYGDYEQLCGRVLRTYSKPYDIAPKKLVYQMLSYHVKDFAKLVENRHTWAESYEADGKSFVYKDKGELSPAALAGWDQRKDVVAAYAPRSWLSGVKAAVKPTNWGMWWDISKQQISQYYTLLKQKVSFAKNANIAETRIKLARLGLEKQAIAGQSLWSALTGNDYDMAMVNMSNQAMLARLTKFEADLRDIRKRKEKLIQDQRMDEVYKIENDEEKEANAYYIDALGDLNISAIDSGSFDFDWMTRLGRVEYYVKQLKQEFMKTPFPDLDQIKVYSKTLPNSQYLPWFRPFEYQVAEHCLLRAPYISSIEYEPLADYNTLKSQLPSMIAKYYEILESPRADNRAKIAELQQFYRNLSHIIKRGLTSITFKDGKMPSIVYKVGERYNSVPENCVAIALYNAGFAFSEAQLATLNEATHRACAVINAPAQNRVNVAPVLGPANRGNRNVAPVLGPANRQPGQVPPTVRRSTRNRKPAVFYGTRANARSKTSTCISKPELKQIIATEKVAELSRAKELIKSVVSSSQNIEPVCASSLIQKIDSINVSNPVSSYVTQLMKPVRPRMRPLRFKHNNVNNEANNNTLNEPVNALVALEPALQPVTQPGIQPVTKPVTQPTFNMAALAEKLAANKAANNARKAANNAARVARNEAELASIPSNLQNLYRAVQATRKNAANKKLNLNAKQRSAEGLAQALERGRAGKEKTRKAQNAASQAKIAYNLAHQKEENAKKAYTNANTIRRTAQMAQEASKGISWAAKAKMGVPKGGKSKTRVHKRINPNTRKTYKKRRN